MAWLWGKINLRSSSSNLLTESLGYMNGSFQILTDKFVKHLQDKGCIFHFNSEVNNIIQNEEKWIVNGEEYDFVLSTVAYPITRKIYDGFLSKKENDIINKVKYTAARTMMLVLNKPFTTFYWLNIGENNIPFGGIIEHTNMVDSKKYSNNHIIYISNYMYQDERLYKLSENELLKEYEPYLKAISKEFDIKNIKEFHVYNELYAQPIIEKNYSKNLLPLKLEKKGLYVATMPQIYPEDRGMNYAIQLGYNVADIINNGLT